MYRFPYTVLEHSSYAVKNSNVRIRNQEVIPVRNSPHDFAVNTNCPLRVLYLINAAQCALDLNYSHESVGKMIDKSYVYFFFGKNEQCKLLNV